MAKFCSECGKKIEDNQRLCDSCRAKRHNDTGNGNFWWAVLGFFIPIVGVVLYFVWKKNRKADAKNAGGGALVSLILWAFVSLSFLIDYKEPTPSNGGSNTIKEVDTKGTTDEMLAWYSDVSNGDEVITIIALSYCSYCKAYKPIITQIAEDEDIALYWFEIDTLSDEDQAVLTGAFDLEKYEGSSPYTFVVKDRAFLGDTVGYMEEENTREFLTSINAL